MWLVGNIGLTSFHATIAFGKYILFFLLLQDRLWLFVLLLIIPLLVKEFDGRIKLIWIGLLLQVQVLISIIHSDAFVNLLSCLSVRKHIPCCKRRDVVVVFVHVFQFQVDSVGYGCTRLFIGTYLLFKETLICGLEFARGCVVAGIGFVSMLKVTFLSRQLGYFISPAIIFQSRVSVPRSIGRGIAFQPTIFRPQALGIVIILVSTFVAIGGGIFFHDFSIKFKANLQIKW